MKALMVGVVLSWLAAVAHADDLLAVKDGWVRWVPPVSGNSAAYFTLTNQTDKPAVLVAAESDAAKAVEIHAVERQGELVQMKQIETLTVPAGDQVVFQPGSYHIMLIGLKAPLQADQSIALTLRFEGGEALAVSLPVRQETGGQHHQYHTHDKQHDQHQHGHQHH